MAQCLEKHPLVGDISPLPVVLNLKPADWRQVAELITVSALYQQFDRGDRVGAYPDSISQFEQRNPAFLNPEDILVNVLSQKGHDPDIQTLRLSGESPPIVISSGASIEKAERDRESNLHLQLRYFEGEFSHTLIAGLAPKAVRVADVSLPRLHHPPDARTRLGLRFGPAMDLPGGAPWASLGDHRNPGINKKSSSGWRSSQVDAAHATSERPPRDLPRHSGRECRSA